MTLKRGCIAVALILLCCCVNADSGTGLLQNPGFEDAPANVGWEIVVYGARPQVELDSQIVRAGRHSLHVTAAEASDTALGQEVALKSNQWYRLSGCARWPGTAPRPPRRPVPALPPWLRSSSLPYRTLPHHEVITKSSLHSGSKPKRVRRRAAAALATLVPPPPCHHYYRPYSHRRRSEPCSSAPR